MTANLFDIIGTSEEEEVSVKPEESSSSQGELDFFSLAEQHEGPEESEEVGYWQSVLNAIPKGAMKGIISFGRMLGPIPDTEEEQFDPNKIAAHLEELFPTGEGAVSGAIERFGEIAPSILGGPGGLAKGVGSVVSRVGTGAVAGEVAKQEGMPEWVQSVAETVPLIAPSLAKMNKAGASEGKIAKFIAEKAPKKIADRVESMMSENASKKELLDFARQAGMTEGEITPLLQGEVKQKFLSKLASKGESTQASLRATQEGVGNIFNSIKESPAAQKVLTESQNTRLVKGLQDKLEQMPSSVRGAIQDDFKQLLQDDMTGEKVIKFFRDINHELGGKTKQLSTLKDPIKKMLMEVDPEMGRSFDLTNKLYGKYAEISKRLKPSQYEKLYAAGKGGAALTSMLTGNFGVIKGLAAYEGSRKLAEHMLTNPRMQSLSSKMISAINSNKFAVAEHIKRQMIDETKDIDPRISKALQEINIKDSLD